MSIPFNFKYEGVRYNASLELTDSVSEKALSINGHHYKILGSEEGIFLIKSHLTSLKIVDFESTISFQASLDGIGPHKKTNDVFQRSVDDCPVPEDESKEQVEAAEALSEIAPFNIHESVHKACDLIETYYIFPDKAKEGIQKLRQNLAEGKYDDIKNANTFSVVFTKDLHEIIQDKHFDIVVLPPNKDQAPLDDEKWISNLIEDNFGFDVEKNAENVGVLKLYGFCGLDFSGRDYVPPKVALKTREAFDKAIDTMRGADAIIVDMRGNGGGSPYAVQFLSSYFLPEQVQLNTIRSREKDKENIQEFNTLSYEELPKDKRLLDVPLYILTSEKTFSAAEEFTYDMQALGRGEIIGETTGGGANPCHLKALSDDGLYIAVPDEEAVNPHTKANWEGQGVLPQHKIAADQALNKASELIKMNMKRS